MRESESAVPEEIGYFAHSTAVIDAGAQIGAGTRIWHFSHVCEGSRIGRRCTLGQNVYVGPEVEIGDGVKIQNNVSVYEGVTLEDFVFCGPSMVFTNARSPRAAFPLDRGSYDRTHVGRGATLGANCTIVCGTRIGRWAFVAAGAVVTRDVAPFALVAGVPGKVIGWVSRAGHRLDFSQGEAVCPQSGERYRFGPGGVELLEEIGDPEGGGRSE